MTSLELSFNDGNISFDTVTLSDDSLRVIGSGNYIFSEATGDGSFDFESLYPDTSSAVLNGSSEHIKWQDSGNISVHVDLSDSASNSAVEVKGESIEIYNIVQLFYEGIPARGTLAFTLGFNGRVDQPVGQLGIILNNPAYGDIILDSLNVSASIKPDSLWVSSLKIESGKGDIHGNAGISHRTDESFFSVSNLIEGTLAGNVLDLGLVNPLLPDSLNLSGQGNFEISWNGTLNEPLYTGSLHITDGVFDRPENRQSIQDITVDMRFQDKNLYVDTVTGFIKDVPFSVSGDISANGIMSADLKLRSLVGEKKAIDLAGFVSPDSLDVKLEMDKLNLATLQPFITQLINLEGIVESAITVKGSFSSPIITGDVHMHDVTFKTLLFNRPVTNGVIDISLNNRTVTVDTLYLKSKDGNVKGEGYFIYSDRAFEEIDLAASIQNMKFDQPDQYDFQIENADVTYTKVDDGIYQLAGTVIVDEGTIDYDLKPQNILLKSNKSNAETDEKPSSLLTDTNLNIRLNNKNPVWLDNNIAHVSLNAQMDIIGTLETPNVTGRISAEDGYVLYLDRRFEITHGTLDFINPSRVNPIIDFQAATNIRQSETFAGETYVIMLNVDGPFDEAAIVINSSPALSKAEILSLLTFGATSDQLTGTQTADQNTETSSIMMERVTELSGTVATNYLSRKISSLLGIKGLNISGNIFGGKMGDQMDAAEKIDRQMKSEYVTSVGEWNNQGIRIRYDISRYFSIEGYTNQTDQGGIDLEYSVTFE